MTDPTPTLRALANHDRELWREREGDYYADSIHVTEGGGIGINCGGTVIVKPLREWHRLALASITSDPPRAATRDGLGVEKENLMKRGTFDEFCERPCVTTHWCAYRGTCLAEKALPEPPEHVEQSSLVADGLAFAGYTDAARTGLLGVVESIVDAQLAAHASLVQEMETRLQQIANYEDKVRLFNPILDVVFQRCAMEDALAIEIAICDAANQQAAEVLALLRRSPAPTESET